MHSVRKRKKTILLLDDEETERTNARQILHGENCTVLEADCCNRALTVFEANRDRIDLLVADIALPHGNGCELALALRQQKPVPLRSVGRESGSVECHADYPNQSVQGTSVPWRGDHCLRAMVPAISARLRTRCRAFGGTRRGSGPQLHLAVGAGLCPRTEQALPPPSEVDQQKLPHRRDVYKGEGRGQ